MGALDFYASLEQLGIGEVLDAVERFNGFCGLVAFVETPFFLLDQGKGLGWGLEVTEVGQGGVRQLDEGVVHFVKGFGLVVWLEVKSALQGLGHFGLVLLVETVLGLAVELLHDVGFVCQVKVVGVGFWHLDLLLNKMFFFNIGAVSLRHVDFKFRACIK